MKKFTLFAGLVLVLVMLSGFSTVSFAQGRGGGRPSSPGPPAGSPGADRGLGTASSRSDGRSDAGLGTASTNSNGRSDTGLDRARKGGMSTMPDQNGLNRYQGIARKLGTTPADLSAQFQAAVAANPNLTWGQFVAANVIADNLNARNPNITASSILLGLQNGDSIGETLRDLGMLKEDAKAAEKLANREIKYSKKH